MHEELFYLKQNVQVEPLFDQWYAWSHLIPPATAARNITERHMKIMDSYISAPTVHAAAVRNPKMLGGPFIDYGGKRVDEIKQLRDRTRAKRANLFQLSAALEELQRLLAGQAKGYSLHPLYAQIPESLRGLVELQYDLRSQPSFRIIEQLLYKTPYYDRTAQTIMLSIIKGDDRPFVLSTPRLESSDTLQLQWAFDDKRIDQLFELKTAGEVWGRIVEKLGIAEGQQEEFRKFFTAGAPPRYEPYSGDGIRWRYFGHACILIESQNSRILLDPVLSYTYESEISRYTYADLPDHIDFALITHNHQDHVLFETLLQLRHKLGCIVVPRNSGGALQDPSLRWTLEQIGFPNVQDLNELETLKFAGGSITGLPFFGEHADLAVASKLAYLVQLGSKRLLFAADSCNIESRLYEHIHHSVGDVDVLFLGMECDGAPLTWLYGPLLLNAVARDVDHSRRLSGSNFEQAQALVNELRCKEVYVYAMGQEPWLNHVMSIKYTPESRPIVESNKLLQACATRNIVAERLFGEREILIEHVYQ